MNKNKQMKKKQIERIAKVLGLTYLELKNSKQNRITTTCRKIMKTMYPIRDLPAKKHISSMSSNEIRAIHCK